MKCQNLLFPFLQTSGGMQSFFVACFKSEFRSQTFIICFQVKIHSHSDTVKAMALQIAFCYLFKCHYIETPSILGLFYHLIIKVCLLFQAAILLCSDYRSQENVPQSSRVCQKKCCENSFGHNSAIKVYTHLHKDQNTCKVLFTWRTNI